ncbi:MAG: class I SAM-dependent methyltransferase [Desulfobacteraceae bacterium]|jgi:ubiquinone/menaquinone biosynthesis C-methylase UbiE
MTQSDKNKMDSDNRFDRLAATWDENPVRVKMARTVANKIVERVSLTQDMKALEFGCGTGLVTVLMAPMLGSITAVDSSENMLAELQKKIGDMGIANIEYHKLDIGEQAVPGSGYDFIFSNMTFHHIEHGDALLKKLCGALASGGVLALTDLDCEDGSFHGDMPGVFHMGFKRGDVVSAFERSGFSNCSVEDVHVIEKPGKEGKINRYPMFLATGKKPVE